MIIYILEWGMDSYYATSSQLMNLLAFPTIEDACSRAMGFEGNIPNIVKYDLDNHKIIKEYTDIPTLNAEIGTVIY